MEFTTITERLGTKIRHLALRNDLAAILEKECGYDKPSAWRIAEVSLRGLRILFPGQSLGDYYLAVTTAEERKQRDVAIRAEFNGRNRIEVCHKYKISKTRLYEIVKAARGDV